MSFRARVTLLVAVAIALTVSAASVAVWATAKHELSSQVDRTLLAPGSHAGRSVTESSTVHATATCRAAPADLCPVTPERELARTGGASDYYTDVDDPGSARAANSSQAGRQGGAP